MLFITLEFVCAGVHPFNSGRVPPSFLIENDDDLKRLVHHFALYVSNLSFNFDYIFNTSFLTFGYFVVISVQDNEDFVRLVICHFSHVEWLEHGKFVSFSCVNHVFRFS